MIGLNPSLFRLGVYNRMETIIQACSIISQDGRLTINTTSLLRFVCMLQCYLNAAGHLWRSCSVLHSTVYKPITNTHILYKIPYITSIFYLNSTFQINYLKLKSD